MYKKTGIQHGGRDVYSYEKKDETVPTTEPEVLKQVLQEVKSLGENSKAKTDELKTSLATLEATVNKHGEKMDAMDTAKVEKLTEDIMTRQEDLEKVTKSAIEDLDTAVKRIGKMGGMAFGGDTPEEKRALVEGAIALRVMKMIAEGQLRPDSLIDVRQEEQAEQLGQMVQELKDYQRVFPLFLRKGTDPQAGAHVSPEHAKLLSVGSDPDGGMLVTPEMSARIVQRVFESDPIRSLANVETIGTDMFEIREDLEEAEDGWESETNSTDETNTPQWNMVKIPAHIQSARPRATQKLLDDASINIEQWLANKISRKFARTEGAAFVTGDGAGKPRGFLTYDAWTTAGAFEFNKVEQVNMGAANTLTTDGFTDVMFALLEEYASRAVWLMNRLAVRDTMKLKDGDGQYIWRPGLQEGVPSTILAHPVRMSTTMPVVAANALSVAIADWSEAYYIIDRQGINVQRDPYTQKPLVEFYTRRRVGGAMVNFQALKIGKVAA